MSQCSQGYLAEWRGAEDCGTGETGNIAMEPEGEDKIVLPDLPAVEKQAAQRKHGVGVFQPVSWQRGRR